MSKEEIYEIVLNTLKEVCKQNELEIEIDQNSALLGTNRVLDSISLVNFLVDLEAVFLEKDLDISLMSENAMSMRISPFRTVNSITNFIESQINE